MVTTEITWPTNEKYLSSSSLQKKFADFFWKFAEKSPDLDALLAPRT